MKKLLVVIPVYNEKDTLSEVISSWSSILNISEFDILAINDGSSDNSLDILNNLRIKYKNLIVLDKKNEGHGPSIIQGYKYSVQQNYEYTFQVDSDDQFKSNDFINIWKFHKDNFDLILGVRKKRNDPFLRVFLSKFILRYIIFSFVKRFIQDANIPYRLVKNTFLKNFLDQIDDKTLAPNILMSMYSKNFKEINITHYARTTGEISWSISKLYKFGKRLLFEINTFKKKF